MSRLEPRFDRMRAGGGRARDLRHGRRSRSARDRATSCARSTRGGADVIEVGVPFSDPIADGPAIQRASERALAAGGDARARRSISSRDVRADDRGADRALHLRQSGAAHGRRTRSSTRAADAGVDGVLLLDLPIEESGDDARARSTRAASIRSFSSARRRPTTRLREAGTAGPRVPVRDFAAGRDRRARHASPTPPRRSSRASAR